MERLKTALKTALAAKANQLVFAEAAIPTVSTSDAPQSLENQAPLTASEFTNLRNFLFPKDHDKFASGQPCKGVLNIPGIDKVSMILTPSPNASIRLYLPPAGNQKFEADWQKISGAAAPASPTTESPATPHAQPMQLAGPHPSNENENDKNLANLAQIKAPLDAPSLGPSAPASAGFIPTGISSPSDVLGEPYDNEPPAEASAPGPAQSAPAPSSSAPAGAGAGEIPGLAAPAQPQQLASTFPEPAGAPVASPASSTKSPTPPTIHFGASRPGEGMISQGLNPIDAILTSMVEKKGSDLHLTMGEPIVMRIDGDIHRTGTEAISEDQMRDLLLPTMPDLNQREFAETNDTDYAYEIQGVGRFRVNIFRDKNGVGSVMRHIPSEILTAEQLGLPPAIIKFCELSKGLVLVTGPTGSGKSTTLAAMVDWINKNRAEHILTVEDPIEFVHQQHRCLVNQRETRRHTSSFSRALKAALREDPDIVLIGEMRDLETIAIAIETAETGHLVFGTLHTTTAVSTVDRIIDQFPADQQEQIRMMLAGSLKGVVAQTLLRRNGGGRVAAHEILVTNDAVSAMIREGKNHMIENHMQTQKADGNQLLNEGLLKWVKEGQVDPQEAFRKSVDKTSFQEVARRLGVNLENPQAPQPARPGFQKRGA